MKLAIVGSTSLGDHAEAWAIVEDIIDKYKPEVVISGGAVGIDRVAGHIAKKKGIARTIHYPAVHAWEEGYKPRNRRIARDCDRLVRIVASDSTTYGSGWTRDRAKEMGKPTENFVIEVD